MSTLARTLSNSLGCRSGHGSTERTRFQTRWTRGRNRFLRALLTTSVYQSHEPGAFPRKLFLKKREELQEEKVEWSVKRRGRVCEESEPLESHCPALKESSPFCLPGPCVLTEQLRRIKCFWYNSTNQREFPFRSLFEGSHCELHRGRKFSRCDVKYKLT